MSGDALLERRYRSLGRFAPLHYNEPLQVVRGDGVWLFDADGRRYLDAYNNVPHVGHCHPRVVQAISRQAATLNVHTRYLIDGVVQYAERLTSTFDPTLSTVMFCCSGSEANELALRLAREHTGGSGIIVTAHTYHGNTAAVIELGTAVAEVKNTSPRVHTISALDVYRDRGALNDADLGHEYAMQVKRAIDAFAADGIKLAALLVCTTFSSEGLPNVPVGFMPEAVELVHAAGGLFIADEVQAGFGRLGTHMWGHQALGVVPDIVTLGKPMGNGHPLAGLVSSPALVNAFESRNMYFNTFGGNPVSCAAGMAVLEVLAEEQLIKNAHTVGSTLTDMLRELQLRHELIGDVRGKGLFLAVELVADRGTKLPAPIAARRVVNAMRQRGVLIGLTGVHDNVLKVRPPMPFSRDDAAQLVDVLDQALTAIRLGTDALTSRDRS